MKRIGYSILITILIPLLYLKLVLFVIPLFDTDKMSNLPKFVQNILMWSVTPGFIWFMSFADVGILPAITILLVLLALIFFISYRLLKKYDLTK